MRLDMLLRIYLFTQKVCVNYDVAEIFININSSFFKNADK